MDEMGSTEFRKGYATITEPTRVVGYWVPSTDYALDQIEAREEGLNGYHQAPTVAYMAIYFRNLTINFEDRTVDDGRHMIKVETKSLVLPILDTEQIVWPKG